MDDFIQVLVLIVTLVIFVVSALRKQKKNGPQNSETLNKTLESLFGIPQEMVNPVVTEEPVKNLQVKKDQRANLSKKTIIQEPQAEGEKVIQDKVEIDEPENEYRNKEFNLRDAVIYSEILSRKAY